MDGLPLELLLVNTYNSYNGQTKNKTPDCVDCKFHVGSDKQESCFWGKSWQYLIATDKTRSCSLTKKPSPREQLYLARMSRGISPPIISINISDKHVYPPLLRFFDTFGQFVGKE